MSSSSDAMRARSVPVKNFDEVVGLIREQIDEGKQDPAIHRAVSGILSRKVGDGWAIEPKDHDAEVRAIFDYVRRNVRYQHDTHGIDTFRSPRRTLELRAGDCDDMTILIGSLAGAAGYPVKVKVVDTSGGGYDHVYPLVGVPPTKPTRWVALDATEPHAVGWEVPRNRVHGHRTYALDGVSRLAAAPAWAWVAVLIGIVGLLRIVRG